MKSMGQYKVTQVALLLATLFGLSGCVTSEMRSATAVSTEAQSVTSVQRQKDQLPLPHGMTRRVLSNGLTVLYYPRQSPQGGLELRLAVRVGSLQEAENERGLAHYVEHMAFNGTRDYPEQTIFKALEAEGIMLGADVNAVTSLAGTTYKPEFADLFYAYGVLDSGRFIGESSHLVGLGSNQASFYLRA